MSHITDIFFISIQKEITGQLGHLCLTVFLYATAPLQRCNVTEAPEGEATVTAVTE